MEDFLLQLVNVFVYSIMIAGKSIDLQEGLEDFLQFDEYGTINLRIVDKDKDYSPFTIISKRACGRCPHSPAKGRCQ